jgi:hypothetical protein
MRDLQARVDLLRDETARLREQLAMQHREQATEIERLKEVLGSIANRLDIALAGDDVCRGCVDVALSYARDASPLPQPETER